MGRFTDIMTQAQRLQDEEHELIRLKRLQHFAEHLCDTHKIEEVCGTPELLSKQIREAKTKIDKMAKDLLELVEHFEKEKKLE